jgi:Na+/melibiose symporter-like transporter
LKNKLERTGGVAQAVECLEALSSNHNTTTTTKKKKKIPSVIGNKGFVLLLSIMVCLHTWDQCVHVFYFFHKQSLRPSYELALPRNAS